ncbi:uncharacterized protein LOC114309146 isoform X3 [Camellia sinensis]|uniref:uncharacterized protein LOC114309146 isoform X3 n=1 Tax=Camellia sinensis TaxID=4442 RepID=UPI0010356E4D|nr:uncharacterized protein LOC114309146 isoform X3 [Camellia sinensis]
MIHRRVRLLIQYDAVGWAPKEYNPDNKQPSGGQEPSGGEVARLRMLIHYNLALFGMKHLAIIMMLLLNSIMMEIQDYIMMVTIGFGILMITKLSSMSPTLIRVTIKQLENKILTRKPNLMKCELNGLISY